MPTYEPDVAVHNLLGSAATTLGLVKATTTKPPFNGNICLASLYEVQDNAPTKAVFVSSLPGGENQRLCGVTADLRREYVLVTIRGLDHDEAGALALARLCRDTLHCADASSYGYFSCYVQEPQPRPQALDDGRRSVYSLTVEMRRKT